MDVWATVQLNADCTLSFTVSSNQPVGQTILWLKKWNNSQESFSRQVRLKVQAQDLRSTAVGHLQHTYTAVVEQEENTSLIYTFAAKLTQCKAVLWMWPVLPDWIFTHSISLTHWERGVTSYGQATASDTGLGCAINRRSLRPAWVCVSVCTYVCVCGSRTKSFLLIRPRTGMEMAPSLRVLGMLRALFNIGAATPYPPPPKKRKTKKNTHNRKQPSVIDTPKQLFPADIKAADERSRSLLFEPSLVSFSRCLCPAVSQRPPPPPSSFPSSVVSKTDPHLNHPYGPAHSYPATALSTW